MGLDAWSALFFVILELWESIYLENAGQVTQQNYLLGTLPQL
jgi:hypothetical protein